MKEKEKLNSIRGLLIRSISSILIALYKTKKGYRKFVLFCIDSFLILLSIKIVTYFLYPVSNELLKGISITKNYNQILPNNFVAIVLILLVYLVYNLTGQYLSLSKYIKSTAIYGIAFRNFLVLSIFLVFKFWIDSTIFDLRQFMLLWLVSTFLIIIFRFTVKEINIYLSSNKSHKMAKVAIYGAGAAGAQLASSLILGGNTKIVAFFILLNHDPRILSYLNKSDKQL